MKWATRLPAVSAKQVMQAIEQDGWFLSRTSGSHFIYKKEGVRNFVNVPRHGAKSLKKGTLHAIVHATGMTDERFMELLG